jgi:hypothetical protein
MECVQLINNSKLFMPLTTAAIFWQNYAVQSFVSNNWRTIRYVASVSTSVLASSGETINKSRFIEDYNTTRSKHLWKVGIIRKIRDR